MLKPFDEFSCRLAGARVESSETSCQIRVHGPDGKEDLGPNPSQNMQLPMARKFVSPMLPPGEYRREMDGITSVLYLTYSV